MNDHSEAFVAFDTSKLRNAVAVAESGRAGEVRFLGEIENNAAATAKLVKKLAAKYPRLTFCYEAGPTGYGLYWQITKLEHECIVAAPSLIPKKPGDRVKTNRRDAVSLSKLLRAGELTAVWVPDRRHEAMRDLTRARDTAVTELRRTRQRISAFLLRQGLHYPDNKKTWSKAHLDWLMIQQLEYPEQRLVFEELLLAERQGRECLERLEQAIRNAVPDWSLAAVVTGLMAMRGLDLTSASTFLAEIGDLSRFQTPRELMAYLGLVPSEDFHRRHDQARPDHQDRQLAGAPHAGGVLLELPASSTGRPSQAAKGGSRPAGGSQDRMEGAVPPVWAVPRTGQERQAQDRCGDGGRTRTRWLHLGRQSRDHHSPDCDPLRRDIRREAWGHEQT